MRTPKSQKIKKLSGNPGQRKIRGEVKPSPKVPKCPDTLDDLAKYHWKSLVPIAVTRGTFCDGDEVAMAMLCTNLALYDAVAGMIQKDPVGTLLQKKFSVDGAGVTHEELKEGPLIKLSKQLFSLNLKGLNEFGFTLKGRKGIYIDEPEEKPGEFD